MSGCRVQRMATALWIAIAVLPPCAYAQSTEAPSQVYAGFTLGSYFENAEGTGYSPGFARSVVVGFGRPRWLFEAEIGQSGRHCEEGSSYCHSHLLLNVGAVRRFEAAGAGPYVVLGCCLIHFGAGLDIPVGWRLVVAPGFDLNLVDPYAAAFRPKMAVLMRW